ncbi:hypothetical protein PC2016_1664 [Pseudoalteromonas carrageenovora]|uniref:Uncharacterized protein n=1 Tax=Pseudoalteromonas carrageenovora IAM 12662 TaxID=1314868 RepID=A0A2K4X9H5_PSEVC|nr:hypothetical protein [Pseudoalteromonas carrageenovora]QBJ71875.1 hypothetical protein PC2016_1664 [Pseudoalteromonas carrageenovora]GEB70089.1 hypothetical protein PCA01_07990 [Pseudoalteromonas carrageenovora]SOU40977.1 conserved protein of unknown function [Pseudoalteromonas carrageenovora IAM 12662]
MEHLIEFVKSDIGVSLAWLCSVGSTIYAIFSSKKNKELKIKIQQITNNTDNSKDSVNQHGQKNVYTKNNSGGMKIDM